MNKREFVERLESVFDSQDVPKHGRVAWLADQLGAQYMQVWKWFNLKDANLPRLDAIIELAKITGKSTDFLLTGKEADERVPTLVQVYADYAQALKSSFGVIEECIATMPALMPLKKSFAAVIKDDSMMSPVGQSFSQDTVMVYEANFESLQSGDLVYASVDDGELGVHRIYIKNGKKEYLKPLNATYENEFSYKILGVFKYAILGLNLNS